MGYGARMLPQAHLGRQGQFQDLGCTLLTKVAARFQKVRQWPWEGTTSNARTLAFIASSVGLATGGFWSVVVARDWGVVVPCVFDSSVCDKVGDNARKGLDELLPSGSAKLGARNMPSARLRVWHGLVVAAVLELLPSTVLELLPPIDDIQETEHNTCEYMQQNSRKQKADGSQKEGNSTKPRRCNDELRHFARRAFGRLGVKRLPREVTHLKGAVKSIVFLKRLRGVRPDVFSGKGWDNAFVARLVALARDSA